MNPLALSTVRRLRDEFEILLDPATPRGLDRIQKIFELSGAVIRTQRDAQAIGCLRPSLTVGGVTLSRLSIGAEEFLREHVQEWFSDEDPLNVMSWAYCHANVRDPREIWRFYSDRDAWVAGVEDWARGLTCSRAELFDAMSRFQKTVTLADQILEKMKAGTPQDPDQVSEDRAGSADWGPLISILCSEYASPDPSLSPPEYWLWRAATEDVALLLDGYLERQRAESGKGGSFSESAVSPFMRAHRALNLYVAQIVAEDRKAADPETEPQAPASYLDGAGPAANPGSV